MRTQLNLIRRQLATAILTAFIGLVGSHAFAKVDINQAIIDLSAGEKTHDEALLRLRTVDQKELVSAVRALLTQTSSQTSSQGFAVRAVSELELKSLQPEVDALVRSTNSFDVLQAAKVSLPELHAKLASLIGRKKNSAMKSTLLSKITDALTDDEFLKLIHDDDYLVRESVVTQFFTSLSSIPAAQQRPRFQQLIALKPVQAREGAMRFYESLDPKVQRALKPNQEGAGTGK